MDLKRAQEIFYGTGSIDVYYNGQPVWIENIHPDSQSADVKYLQSSENKPLKVSITELEEGRRS